MKLDILAFGIHPDDVELSAGGTLAKHKALGYKVGICDLTRGELGSRGSGAIRLEEAEKARNILNVDIRENLKLEDAWMLDNKDNQLKIIEIIRKYTPKIVLCNASSDRHPDHAKGAEIVAKAFFLSGLSRIETYYEGVTQDSFRPQVLYNYIQFEYQNPDFSVDISDYIDVKFESIKAYSSQFYNPQSDEPETFISDQSFLEMIKAKDIIMGKSIGVKYAEGFKASRSVGINDLMELI